MEKKLEDYLHLYLGCKFVMKIKGTEELTAVMTFGYEALCATFSGKKEDLISPILLLRPLSSMTEEEMLEFARILRPEATKVKRDENTISSFYDSGNFFKWNHHSLDNPAPEQFRYLLSKGFDLFGLIEAGLAIDLSNPGKK